MKPRISRLLAITALVVACPLGSAQTLAQIAPVETVLYSFEGGSDGGDPLAGLIAEGRGALYGTTRGASPDCIDNTTCGTVLQLTPPAKHQTAWTETVLYQFCSLPNCSDGGNPLAGLIADAQGALYGTTTGGGATGRGTVFKLTPPAKGQTAWTETVLYSFCSLPNCSDGDGPFRGNLLADTQGALYGTTIDGGTGRLDGGTVFKLSPPSNGQTDWTETVLYSFCSLPNCGDGKGPIASTLIADERGALYGTTSVGGATGNGTVFKLTPPTKGQTNWSETVLYSFCSLPNCSDGSTPVAGLIFENHGAKDAEGHADVHDFADKHGALYGTTFFGGGASNSGTIFKLASPPKGQADWTETVLYSFAGKPSDGDNPSGLLIADRRGALYGTTEGGGAGQPGGGIVFKLAPPAKHQTGWTETVLYDFCSLPNCSDGSSPQAGLIADKKGALYSTTLGGGSAQNGTVFKLDLRDHSFGSDPDRGGTE
jgi:uncharacterized repeat protein (TIGR03803 family)